MRQICSVLLTISMVFSLTACSSDSSTWQEQYDLGIRYLSEGNYEEAIIAFTAAIEIDPKEVPAYVGRGDAYIGSGKTEDNLTAAKVDYEMAIELDETCAEAYIGLADVYIAQGSPEKASEILNQAIEVVGETGALATVLERLEEYMRDVSDENDEELSSADAFQPLDGYPKEERHDMDDGSYIKVSYNQFGERIEQTIYNADGTVQSSEQCEYNENGRLLYDTHQQYGDIDYISTRYYDHMQRLESQERITVDNTNSGQNSFSHTETYTYSYQDQTVEIHASALYPNGDSFECGMTYAMESGLSYVEAFISTRWIHGSNGRRPAGSWIGKIDKYAGPFDSVGYVKYDENGAIELGDENS